MTCNTTPKRISTEYIDISDTLWPVKKKLSGYLEKKEIKNSNISRNSTIQNVKKHQRIGQDKTCDNIFTHINQSLKNTSKNPSNQLKYNSLKSSFIELIRENDNCKVQNFSKTIVSKLNVELCNVKNSKNTQRNPKRFVKERNYK